MRERRVYLIRHARPALPEEPVYLGRTDLPLDDVGREQARLLGVFFAGRALTVYSSPMLRCVETARVLTPAPIQVPGLREIDMGTWELRPRAEIRANFPELYAARGDDLAHFCPPEGECFSQCATRAWAALRTLLRESEGDVAVVAHGGVNRALLCRATGRPLGELMAFPQRYCGISTLRMVGGGLVLEQLDRPPWAEGEETDAG